MVTFSTSQDISSLKPGSSDALRIEHDKLGAVALSPFELRTMPNYLGNVSMSELATQVPLMITDDQLINFLRDAGVDYDSSTKEFKIKDDGQTFRLTQDNLITTNFGELFYNKSKKRDKPGLQIRTLFKCDYSIEKASRKSSYRYPQEKIPT